VGTFVNRDTLLPRARSTHTYIHTHTHTRQMRHNHNTLLQSLTAVSTLAVGAVYTPPPNDDDAFVAMTTSDTATAASDSASAASDSTGTRTTRRADRRLVDSCQSCHVGPPVGPPFWSYRICIFDQLAGTLSPEFPYSRAMRDSGVIWNATTLDLWLENPQALIPGTVMEGPGIRDPMERKEIILTLKAFCVDAMVEEDDGGKFTGMGDDGTLAGKDTAPPVVASGSSSSLSSRSTNLSVWMAPFFVVSSWMWTTMITTRGSGSRR
jgi:cytochrome c2